MNTQLLMYTATGEAHGLVNALTNHVTDDGFKNMKPEHKKDCEAQKKEDGRIVEAKYLNSKSNTERLEKVYCKYAGEPLQIWKFIPGRVYKVPVGLINEVNDKNKVMKKRSGLLSLDGKPVTKDESPLGKDEEGEWIHQFVPVAFA